MRESIVRAAELEHAAHNRIHKHKRFDENKLNKHFCCVLFVFWIKIKENEREALGESEKARGLDYVRCVYANVRRTCVLGRSYLAMMMNAASSGKVKLRARERAMHIPAQTYVVVTKQISVLICSVMHSKIYTQTELRKHIIKRPNKKCCVCSVCSVCVCVWLRNRVPGNGCRCWKRISQFNWREMQYAMHHHQCGEESVNEREWKRKTNRLSIFGQDTEVDKYQFWKLIKKRDEAINVIQRIDECTFIFTWLLAFMTCEQAVAVASRVWENDRRTVFHIKMSLHFFR